MDIRKKKHRTQHNNKYLFIKAMQSVSYVINDTTSHQQK